MSPTDDLRPAQLPTDPDEVGKLIRRMLLSIRDPDDKTGDRAEDPLMKHAHHHGTDALRARALAVGGICFLNPFEMACEGCGCPWSEADPEGSMRRYIERYEEIHRDLGELQDRRLGIWKAP